MKCHEAKWSCSTSTLVHPQNKTGGMIAPSVGELNCLVETCLFGSLTCCPLPPLCQWASVFVLHSIYRSTALSYNYSKLLGCGSKEVTGWDRGGTVLLNNLIFLLASKTGSFYPMCTRENWLVIILVLCSIYLHKLKPNSIKILFMKMKKSPQKQHIYHLFLNSINHKRITKVIGYRLWH